MLNGDNPLVHHIIASFNDPDPDRALRYRPFVYDTARQRQQFAFPRPQRVSALHTQVAATIAAIQRWVRPSRAVTAPCCTPACCSS